MQLPCLNTSHTCLPVMLMATSLTASHFWGQALVRTCQCDWNIWSKLSQGSHLLINRLVSVILIINSFSGWRRHTCTISSQIPHTTISVKFILISLLSDLMLTRKLNLLSTTNFKLCRGFGRELCFCISRPHLIVCNIFTTIPPGYTFDTRALDSFLQAAGWIVGIQKCIVGYFKHTLQNVPTFRPNLSFLQTVPANWTQLLDLDLDILDHRYFSPGNNIQLAEISLPFSTVNASQPSLQY